MEYVIRLYSNERIEKKQLLDLHQLRFDLMINTCHVWKVYVSRREFENRSAHDRMEPCFIVFNNKPSDHVCANIDINTIGGEHYEKILEAILERYYE